MKGKLDELSPEELQRVYLETKEELRKERFKAVTSKVDNPKKIQALKKTVARVLTLKRERELAIRPSK